VPDRDDRPLFRAEATHVSGRRLIAHWIDGVLVGLVFAAVLVVGLLLQSVGNAASGVIHTAVTVLTLLVLVVACTWAPVGHLRHRFGDRWGKTDVVDADELL
jgi:hypothetical protein